MLSRAKRRKEPKLPRAEQCRRERKRTTTTRTRTTAAIAGVAYYTYVHRVIGRTMYVYVYIHEHTESGHPSFLPSIPGVARALPDGRQQQQQQKRRRRRRRRAMREKFVNVSFSLFVFSRPGLSARALFPIEKGPSALGRTVGRRKDGFVCVRACVSPCELSRGVHMHVYMDVDVRGATAEIMLFVSNHQSTINCKPWTTEAESERALTTTILRGRRKNNHADRDIFDISEAIRGYTYHTRDAFVFIHRSIDLCEIGCLFSLLLGTTQDVTNGSDVLLNIIIIIKSLYLRFCLSTRSSIFSD